MQTEETPIGAEAANEIGETQEIFCDALWRKVAMVFLWHGPRGDQWGVAVPDNHNSGHWRVVEWFVAEPDARAHAAVLASGASEAVGTGASVTIQ